MQTSSDVDVSDTPDKAVEYLDRADKAGDYHASELTKEPLIVLLRGHLLRGASQVTINPPPGEPIPAGSIWPLLPFVNQIDK